MEGKVKYLSAFTTKERFNLMQAKAEERTAYITVCLENIYQAQNMSAVIRTCEAFGIQNVHIIEEENNYDIDIEVALGTDKWVDIHKYNKKNSTKEVVNKLKQEGYRIVSTIPSEKGNTLENFDLNKGKVALFFGTELTGLSDYLVENSDEYLHIPMCGFVESLNISVSAAVIIHYLTLKLRNSSINWKLSDQDKTNLLLNWLKKSVRASEEILERYKIDFNKN